MSSSPDRVPPVSSNGSGPGDVVSGWLVFGTYEEALAMVGCRYGPRTAATPISAARIQHFSAMVRDSNPAYWDQEFAMSQWGRSPAPPAMLMAWLIPAPWLPGHEPPVPGLVVRIPLPGTTIINAVNDVEFFEQAAVGDTLSVVEELVSVSPLKRTRLGTGHFVQTRETYSRQDGVVIAENRNTLFRFLPGETEPK